MTRLICSIISKACKSLYFISRKQNRNRLASATTAYEVSIVKPVLSDHIKRDIFLAFQTGGCLPLHDSSAHSAISNHLSIVISISTEWVVSYNRFNCT